MKTNIILTLGVLMLALGFIGCTASISTNSNANAKPANTNSAANTTNTASNTTSNTAAASDKTAAQDFTLINKTGVVIDKLYISPANADDWQENILGQEQLADGSTVDIK